MLGPLLAILRHPLVFAAGVLVGALLGWAGLRALWADALAAAKKV